MNLSSVATVQAAAGLGATPETSVTSRSAGEERWQLQEQGRARRVGAERVAGGG